MKLKLKESIRANGVQYLPPAVIDTDEIGITQADADVLIRRGTAVSAEDVAPAEPESTEQTEQTETAEAAPEVIHVDQPAAETEPEPASVTAPAKASSKKK